MPKTAPRWMPSLAAIHTMSTACGSGWTSTATTRNAARLSRARGEIFSQHEIAIQPGNRGDDAMLIAAKILLTLTILGYALITIKADFNKTHATNPKWTPHARFHVVWQILSYAGGGLVALYLVWIDGQQPLERLYLAAALSSAIYGG